MQEQGVSGSAIQMTKESDGSMHKTEELGKPVLICRWRLAGGALPMENRHLRALRDREISGLPVPAPLVAWAKEHIDWTLEAGSKDYPDGVLMLMVDENFKAVMTVGPYQPLTSPTLQELVLRSQDARRESLSTRVAPETMWLIRNGQLEWLDERSNIAAGAASFVADLARTLGINVIRSATQAPYEKNDSYEGVFLVSDEHGVVVPIDKKSLIAQRFAEGYKKLLCETMRRKACRLQRNAT